MRSTLPKVMHLLAGFPLLRHVLATCGELGPARIVVVAGPDMPSVEAAAAPHAVALQQHQRGTGDAVLAALPTLTNVEATDLLVVCGDTPLVTPETLRRLIAARREQDAAVAVLGMRVVAPNEYGKLLLNAEGMVDAIVEASEATPEQQAITLCNAGVMVLDAKRASDLLSRLQPANRKGEYYLTDVVGLARRDGALVAVAEAAADELAGINTRADLAAVEATLQGRLRARAMAGGVTLSDPGSIYLAADTIFSQDVVIGQNVVFGPGVIVESGVEIRAFCHIEGATLRKGAVIGPFARLRPGSEIGEGAHVGNFVELKNTQLGAGAKANHLAYLGDATVGAGSNVGAGTITCNYDGFAKHRTVVGTDVFIGSNSALVAPVRIGDGAMIAAGSVVTRDVAADALAIGRTRQADRADYARRFREQKRETGKG